MEYYILNTNRKMNPSGDDEFRMLDEGIAAAYLKNKKKVDKLETGDVIFLYRVGEGVIAYGTVDSKLHVKTYKKLPGEEHYKFLTNFYSFPDTPISAEDIKSLTDHKIAFQQAIFKIRPLIGKALLSECENRSQIARAA